MGGGGGRGALKCVLSIVTYDILRHSLERGLIACFKLCGSARVSEPLEGSLFNTDLTLK